MYLNQFSVRVPEGIEKASGYVELDHMQRYTLVLRNNRSVRCDARVEIDGNNLGTFRIAAHDNITLERGLDNDGYLTACVINSPEAQQGELKNDQNLGLISVTFTPEVEWRPTGQIKSLDKRGENTSFWGKCALSSEQSLGMGTVSTGHSNQKFTNAGPIVYDYTQRTTINLRLIRRQNTVRPLTQRENPVPPRIY